MSKEYIHNQITVVVPCYHSVCFLDRLWKSLMSQTFKDFKVIFVNDGDEDQDLLLAEYQKQDSRVLVVKKEHGGVSSARNAGLNLADTEWLVFVDPDDDFGPQYLASLYRSVNGTNVDFGMGGFFRKNCKNMIMRTFLLDAPMDGISLPMEEAFSKMTISYYANPWNFIYRTQFLHKHQLRFDESVFVMEGLIFNQNILLRANSVALLRNCGYIFNTDHGTNTISYYDENFVDTRKRVIAKELEIRHKFSFAEDEINECRRMLLAQFGFLLTCNIFKQNSPYTIPEASRYLKANIWGNQEIFHSIKTSKWIEKRPFTKIFRFLVKTGSPILLILIFRLLYFLKARFSVLSTYFTT